MSRFIFTLLISSLFLSCEKESKTITINEDSNLEGLIEFQETPKVCDRWLDQKEMEIRVKKTNGSGREFKLETYVDGQMYEVIRGNFNDYNSKRQVVRIPSFKNKGIVEFESKFFIGDEFVDSESTSIIYLDQGGKASFVDYTKGSGSYCGQLQFFTDKKLHPLPAAGNYKLNIESKHHTFRKADGSAMTVITHDCNHLVSSTGKGIIPIPPIPNDTFYYPKEFRIVEGKQAYKNTGELVVKADDVGKYLAYSINIDAAGHYMKAKQWGSDLTLFEENCLYLPKHLSLYSVHYPDSISNQYLSLVDN